MKTTTEQINKIVYDLENEAEAGNYHDLCEMYRRLSDILLKKLSEKSALAVLKEVKKQGGFLP